MNAMNSDAKVVYLLGAGGKGNIGAEAIALAIIKFFQHRYGHVRFLVSAWYPERMRELLSQIPGDFSLIEQESLLANPLTLAQADFSVVCGDVSISESVVSFLPLYYALRTASANLAGRNVIFFGVEAEEINRYYNLCGLRWLVDRACNTLVMRNEESLSNAGRIPMLKAGLLLGTEPTLALTKGDVLGFDYDGTALSRSKLRVGFGIRDHFTQPFKVDLLRGKLARRKGAAAVDAEAMSRIMEFTSRIADYMVQRYDAQIIFVPHHYLPEGERVIKTDGEVAHMIMEDMPRDRDVVVIEDRLHPFEVINLYSRLDLVFSMRHHTNAFAYLNHVPTLGYGIYPKIRAFFSHIGKSDMLIDPFTTDMSEIYSKIDHVVKHRESISMELKTGLKPLQAQLAAALDVALNDGPGVIRT
jgi:polysaccharide pyruvyl transferase WcaK-like protein